MTPAERGKVPGHQARARRPDPGRRAGRPGGDGGRRLRRCSRHRGRPARGRVLRDACSAPRPAAVRRRAPRVGAQPRRRSTTPDFAHTDHVARARADDVGRARRSGVHPAIRERELLWAAAMLHDIGIAVDYDDHHKHSRYLILNAGLPGFSPRETALIGQMARYHRKGNPRLGRVLAAGARRRRGAARRAAPPCCGSPSSSSARATRPSTRVGVKVEDGARRAAAAGARGRHDRALGRESEADVFKRAFGRELEISVGPKARTTAR